ncbi:hypothetical protein [Klebsiella pneumoniae]|uniref:hypothetical protein n=1 Tax=Klebsiella pneumoniae TaxID=573 RepID=UPI001FF388BC|nr:hypothetical protein [Klebsiella pneumoniae]UOV84388.1 hypothetical protein MU320_29130 [Klebsiella pneumoniae]
MADDIDKAQAADEVNTQDALERQRLMAAIAPRIKPRGECLNPRCGEPFAAGDVRLFCNDRCAGEYRRLARV